MADLAGWLSRVLASAGALTAVWVLAWEAVTCAGVRGRTERVRACAMAVGGVRTRHAMVMWEHKAENAAPEKRKKERGHKSASRLPLPPRHIQSFLHVHAPQYISWIAWPLYRYQAEQDGTKQSHRSIEEKSESVRARKRGPPELLEVLSPSLIDYGQGAGHLHAEHVVGRHRPRRGQQRQQGSALLAGVEATGGRADWISWETGKAGRSAGGGRAAGGQGEIAVTAAAVRAGV
ncbi:hypothetical protein CFC21_095702 [Triticum aestivum]|uniref:Uncharacterized protein n=2 Tax=Triticum aestivum TaxID=4565 RepID=A0A9R1MXQ6_WHEAT|nr:hypothetical protein CFC21_095700 [Triticum aestivum]KAF7093280.1 hypothetical protein CFC21_095702 [Triticum aestivum]